MAIVREGLIEKEALALERELIAEYGRRQLRTGTLCNLTDGGEGVSGLRHSKESIEKMRAVKRGKKQSPEIIERRIAPLRNPPKERREFWSKMNKGNQYALGNILDSETKQAIGSGIKAYWASLTREQRAQRCLKMSAAQKEVWAKASAERRADRGASISAAKRQKQVTSDRVGSRGLARDSNYSIAIATSQKIATESNQT